MRTPVRVASRDAANDPFDRIVSALHDAALEPRLWRRATALIDDACGLHGSHLYLLRERAGGPAQYLCGSYLSHGVARDDIERRYAERYFALDERVPRLLRVPPGCLLHNDDLLTAQEQAECAAFTEHLGAWGRDQLNVRFDIADDLRFFWTVTRAAASGDWRRSQLRLLGRLLPHVRHAVRVAHALNEAQHPAK